MRGAREGSRGGEMWVGGGVGGGQRVEWLGREIGLHGSRALLG